MTDKFPLTAETLRHLLQYDPSTGLFTWRVAPSSRVKVGDIAGSMTDRGYIKIKVQGTRYFAHRLAFLWMTGQEPQDQVDHINRNRSDNRWENLRPATASENQRNRDRQSNNTSGAKGVSWDKEKRKWRVRIQDHGQCIFLGYFDCPHIAEKVYQAVARALWGEFHYSLSAA